MLQTKWLVALVMLWIVAGLLSGIAEGTVVTAGEESAIETLMDFQITKTTEFWGFLSLPVPNTDWFTAFGQIFIWDFGAFEGDWGLIRWIFFVPISIGLGISLVLTLIQIVRGS